ncbi:TPA: hypothetical protein ACIBOM_001639 [Salmonella enterica subsp. enterica serovar Reading]|uniref:hypothetical protein n=1 Tax=Salmonella enterica TaxID=28901 RepID=UPI0029414B43|nr:hypothetical protein [Salmonella enterica subsp. enterica]HEC7605851.1 hypothetical protein [Salmonella enterica subsp. enterica serovar Muenchen]
MSYGYGIHPKLPPELQEIDNKAQGATDVTIAIIALLIEESKNPDETKKKISTLLSKYSSTQRLVHFSRLSSILK